MISFLRARAAVSVLEKPECPVRDASTEPILRVQGVYRTFRIGRGEVHRALCDVSLAIDSGEFVCLVGPSGCGKSTLVLLMAGLDRQDEGQVFFRGVPVRGPGPDRAVMFQEHALFPWRTVFGNVAYPLERAGWPKEKIAQRVDELLRMVHLSSFARSRVHELSGGMRQRVAFARALAGDPEVLLLDEPFAALDGQTRQFLLTELQRLWRERGKTVVFVTHNVLEAVLLGTRVVVMGTRPGRIRSVFPVDLPFPRRGDDRRVTLLVARIERDLRTEIDRVRREEFGDEFGGP